MGIVAVGEYTHVLKFLGEQILGPVERFGRASLSTSIQGLLAIEKLRGLALALCKIYTTCPCPLRMALETVYEGNSRDRIARLASTFTRGLSNSLGDWCSAFG
jgi:hypothetical protein